MKDFKKLSMYDDNMETTASDSTTPLLGLDNVSLSLTDSEEEYEPYFGWCNVEGCEREGANGGSCWRNTGYWTVCSKHSQEYREGKPQPPMKQWAIDREKRRGEDGVLVNEC